MFLCTVTFQDESIVKTCSGWFNNSLQLKKSGFGIILNVKMQIFRVFLRKSLKKMAPTFMLRLDKMVLFIGNTY